MTVTAWVVLACLALLLMGIGLALMWFAQLLTTITDGFDWED